MTDAIVPAWRDPFLVAAFGGWGDAAGVATTSASFLMQKREVARVLEFDAEDYFVLSDTRPHVRLDDKGRRRVQWPQLALISASGGTRDAAVLLGPEPQLQWRSFTKEAAAFWRQHGKGGPVVLLGAFLAGVSHIGPTMLTGFATTPALVEKLAEFGVQRSGYEGPTSVHSALADAFEAEGIPCISFWAAVPHYLGAVPNPKACAALLRCVDRLIGLDLDLRELEEAAVSFEKQVGLALARTSPAIALGQDPPADESASESPATHEPLPPTEDLVRDVEEFFRKRTP